MNPNNNHLNHVKEPIDSLCRVLLCTCADDSDESGIINTIASWTYCPGCGTKLQQTDKTRIRAYTLEAIERTTKIKKASGSVPCPGGYNPGMN